MALIDKIKEEEEKKELSKYDDLLNQHDSLKSYLSYVNSISFNPEEIEYILRLIKRSEFKGDELSILYICIDKLEKQLFNKQNQ